MADRILRKFLFYICSLCHVFCVIFVKSSECAANYKCWFLGKVVGHVTKMFHLKQIARSVMTHKL